MTKLEKAWIPNDIDSVEKLIVWGMEILQYKYPETTYIDSLDQNGEDLDLRVAEGNPFFLTAPSPAEYRYLSRSAIKLSPDHKLYGKLYQHALPIDNPANPQSVPPELRQGA